MHCTFYVFIIGLFEYCICVILLDVGGGFGNKVLVYFGYICAMVGLMLIGKLVKWMEDCSENLMLIGFVRDYVMRGWIVVICVGEIFVVDVDVIVDYGAFNVMVQLSCYLVGFFSVFIGFYDIVVVYCCVIGVYINKALGGVAYACSFWIVEVVYFVECVVDCFVRELELDLVELRLKNFLCFE